MQYPRDSKEYERMVDLAISIIEDYNITEKSYPLNMYELYDKMGIRLSQYSLYDDNKRAVELLEKKSKDGFCLPLTSNLGINVLINDRISNNAHNNHTMAHELKHIIENDKDDSEDDLCDYFARYLRCPLPLVIYYNLSSIYEIVSMFALSYEQAGYVLNNKNKRVYKYGVTFQNKEIELLKQLIGEDFDYDLKKHYR